RVIADHARAATFLISDGVLPSNEGRGYVLRKIMRRGIRHGRLLGATKPFLCEMVYAARDLMKDAYPELVESAPRVDEIGRGEETRVARVLAVGLRELDIALGIPLKTAPAGQDYEQDATPHFTGQEAFHLYETFGLPLDFMIEAARDRGIEFPLDDFNRWKE